jgi:hypothetical protein
MRADYPVLLDACVFAHQGVCDLFLRLAERPRLFVPYWSEAIPAEVKCTQVKKLGWPPELADYFQQQNQDQFSGGSRPRLRTLDPGADQRRQRSSCAGGGDPR